MNLTRDQLQAIQRGESIHVRTDTGVDAVVVRADVFSRMQAALDESVSAIDVGQLIAESMREYDQDDPLLDAYQAYRP